MRLELRSCQEKYEGNSLHTQESGVDTIFQRGPCHPPDPTQPLPPRRSPTRRPALRTSRPAAAPRSPRSRSSFIYALALVAIARDAKPSSALCLTSARPVLCYNLLFCNVARTAHPPASCYPAPRRQRRTNKRIGSRQALTSRLWAYDRMGLSPQVREFWCQPEVGRVDRQSG